MKPDDPVTVAVSCRLWPKVRVETLRVVDMLGEARLTVKGSAALSLCDPR